MRSISKTVTDSENLTMESLALPQELYWDGKVEPNSPSASELFSITEPARFWLNDDNFLNDIVVSKDDILEMKPGMEILSGDDIVVEFYDFQEAKLGIVCPTPVANVCGKYFSVEHINGGDHVVRLLQYIPGQMFHEVEKTNHLLYQSGEYIAKIDKALKNFQHDAYNNHKTLWMLQSLPQLKDFLYVLTDHSRKAMIEEIIAEFEQHVLSQLDKFEMQIIHGDYNEQNIIVEPSKTTASGEYKVKGIIDFGDTNKSPVLFEIGVAMTYMMLQAKTLESGGIFLAGYTSVRPISAEEKPLLKYCVAARLAQSLVMGAYTHSLDPSNDYVLVTHEVGWKMIEELWRTSFTQIDELWQTTADKYLTQSVK